MESGRFCAAVLKSPFLPPKEENWKVCLIIPAKAGIFFIFDIAKKMFISVFKQLAKQKFRFLARWLKEENLPPVVFIPIIIFLFGYFSYLIVIKKQAALAYVFTAIYLLIFTVISKEKRQFYEGARY